MRIYLLLVLFSFLLHAKSEAQSLVIDLQGVKTKEGEFHIGLYRNSDDFPIPEATFRGIKMGADSLKTGQIRFNDLPPGRYAIAIFQDLNGNNKLDIGPFGIPTEPYGFSNSAVNKWRKPTFDQVAIEYFGGEQTTAVKVQKWGDK